MLKLLILFDVLKKSLVTRRLPAGSQDSASLVIHLGFVQGDRGVGVENTESLLFAFQGKEGRRIRHRGGARLSTSIWNKDGEARVVETERAGSGHFLCSFPHVFAKNPVCF